VPPTATRIACEQCIHVYPQLECISRASRCAPLSDARCPRRGSGRVTVRRCLTSHSCATGTARLCMHLLLADDANSLLVDSLLGCAGRCLVWLLPTQPPHTGTSMFAWTVPHLAPAQPHTRCAVDIQRATSCEALADQRDWKDEEDSTGMRSGVECKEAGRVAERLGAVCVHHRWKLGLDKVRWRDGNAGANEGSHLDRDHGALTAGTNVTARHMGNCRRAGCGAVGCWQQ